MRTITNEADLPLPMFNALSHDGYVGGGDISSTRLIAPPRIVTLRKFHEDEIVEDASDRIWSLLGQSTHAILERSVKPGQEKMLVVETRLSMPIQGIEDDSETGFWKWTVSGQPDVYQYTNRNIYDYKVTSVWSVIFGKSDWERQLNIQAALHRHKGDEVDGINIIAIIRDHQKRKAKLEKDYPPQAVKRISFPMWTQEETIEYMKGRVRLHQKAQLAYARRKKDTGQWDDSVLPMCTDDERWYRGAVFAVKYQDKNGKINKNAKRKFDNLTDARQFVLDNANNVPKGKTFAPIEERKGEYKRCMEYCDVWKFCAFGRQVHAEAVAANGLGNENESSEDED